MLKSNHQSARMRMEIDRQSRTPVYRQIHERVCDAIKQGILRSGDRLPSARSLANQLSTSRGTVDLAYSLLSGEGYILSQGAAGTTVAHGLEAVVNVTLTRRAIPDCAPTPEKAVVPFQMGLPALDAFPRKLWSRLAVRRARVLTDSVMGSPNPVGFMPLREAIAAYLAVARGVVCSPEQVIVTSGFQAALGMITRTFLRHGDAVWFEDPGYFLAREGLEAAGAKLIPVPVDSEGLQVATGMDHCRDARMAYVTPSHQAPLGVTMSHARRMALLSWAARTQAWIIEDDYDSEFRYGSRPQPALKSLDESGRVLYVGSFSKVLFPGLRLGYIVVPESEVGRLNEICELLYRDRPVSNQAVVTDFMVEGHFARHIRRMRSLYSTRRTALAAALTQVFEGQVHVELQAGGMHLLARFEGCESDIDYVKRAVTLGLAPAALSPWSMVGDCGTGLLLSFTNILPETAFEMATRLKQASDRKHLLRRSRSEK